MLRGVEWPWSKSPQWEYDLDVIRAAIETVLFTQLGERKNETRFGSQLMYIMFENKGPAMEGLARREISLALQEHIPYIRLESIDFVYPKDDNKPVDINVSYIYLGQPDKLTLAGQTA